MSESRRVGLAVIGGFLLMFLIANMPEPTDEQYKNGVFVMCSIIMALVIYGVLSFPWRD